MREFGEFTVSKYIKQSKCDLKLKQVVKGEMQVVSRMRDLPEAGMINGAIIRPIYF